MILKDFQAKKEAERLVFSKLALILVSFLAILAVWGAFGAWRKKLVLNREIKDLQSNIVETEKKGKMLETRLGELNTSEGIEKEARSRFNFQKSGEEVAIFLDEVGRLGSVNNDKNKLALIWTYVKNILFGR